MQFKITTLVENAVYGRKLQGEHGLSMLIETDEVTLLFDTGQSDLFIQNATLLGKDLSTVDYLILSHGHSDHTGGLRDFLRLNQKATVVCKREALYRKFKLKRENGLIHPEQLDLSRFQFINSRTELIPGVFLFPELPIIDPEETHFDQFFTETPDGLLPDQFNDELAIALLTATDYGVLSACSHRGITNILRIIQQNMGNRSFKFLVGGFHIHQAPTYKYKRITDFLQKNLPEQIGICHCTGIDKYALFQQMFENQVFYNHTGYSFYL